MLNNTRIPQRRGSVKRRKDKPSVLRGKITRVRTGLNPGADMERSINMERGRACAFALAMQARPDIARAEFVRDHQATQERDGAARWYVRFARKACAVSLSPVLRGMQDARAQRACDQADEMEFLPMPDKAGWYWCIHQYPDEAGRCGVYETHPTLGCTCPDYQYRCSALALSDKHELLLRARLGMALPAARVEVRAREESPAERRARLTPEMALDF